MLLNLILVDHIRLYKYGLDGIIVIEIFLVKYTIIQAGGDYQGITVYEK